MDLSRPSLLLNVQSLTKVGPKKTSVISTKRQTLGSTQRSKIFHSLDAVQNFCAVMMICGLPGQAFSVYEQPEATTEETSNILQTNVYTLAETSAASLQATIMVRGFGGTREGTFEILFEQQSCIGCFDPPKYDCTLDSGLVELFGIIGCTTNTDNMGIEVQCTNWIGDI
jgi:hypothetical protein